MCMDMTKDSQVACALAVECPQPAPLAVRTVLPSFRHRAAATLSGERVLDILQGACNGGCMRVCGGHGGLWGEWGLWGE